MQTPSASTVTMLHDPAPAPRAVSMADWSADGAKVAAAYAIMDFQQQPANMSLHSYVWDLQNPNTPEYTMQPLSQIVSARFNLKDPNIVGAGLYNGQFAVFDMRKGGVQARSRTPSCGVLCTCCSRLSRRMPLRERCPGGAHNVLHA
jgi:dynein intermediate chain 2, axonemal